MARLVGSRQATTPEVLPAGPSGSSFEIRVLLRATPSFESSYHTIHLLAISYLCVIIACGTRSRTLPTHRENFCKIFRLTPLLVTFAGKHEGRGVVNSSVISKSLAFSQQPICFHISAHPRSHPFSFDKSAQNPGYTSPFPVQTALKEVKYGVRIPSMGFYVVIGGTQCQLP